MTFQLPRLPDNAPAKDLGALSLRLRQFGSDCVEFLRGLPSIEYKTITTVGGFPIYVKTTAPVVLEVRRARSYETKNTANVVADTSIGWRPSDDPRQPGVLITELGGLTRDTDYTVVLAIQGAH